MARLVAFALAILCNNYQFLLFHNESCLIARPKPKLRLHVTSSVRVWEKTMAAPGLNDIAADSILPTLSGEGYGTGYRDRSAPTSCRCPRTKARGGGGVGDRDKLPAPKGALPKLSREQIKAPAVVSTQ